jgi:hypothetical protein
LETFFSFLLFSFFFICTLILGLQFNLAALHGLMESGYSPWAPALAVLPKISIPAIGEI